MNSKTTHENLRKKSKGAEKKDKCDFASRVLKEDNLSNQGNKKDEKICHRIFDGRHCYSS